MKKILLLAILSSFTSITWADTGIFESYVILNNGSTTYYDAQANTANPDFQNANLGTFAAGSTFFLQGGEIKTWKNNGGDVTGGYLYYRVYVAGDTAPSFIEINLPFVENLPNAGDQKWANTVSNINLLNGLAAGNYILEVYFKATTNEGDKYSNNGGSNFIANFTVSNNVVLNGIVTITPSFPTRSEQITITLDATGTALEGETKVYLHSGVGTESISSKTFNHTVGNWGTDDGIGEMTATGNPNEWTITLPSIDNYYNLDTNIDAFALNFLFRNANGTAKEDNIGANYHLAINPGNYFLITNPTYNPFLVETNQPFNISGESNISADWTLTELDENGLVINADINSNTTQNYTFSHSISDVDITHYYQISVDFGTETKTKNFEVRAYATVKTVTLPPNAKKGINYNFPNTNQVTFVLHTPTNTTYQYFDSNNCENTSTATTASKNIVHLIGDFNNWEITSAYQLNKDGDYWWITLNTTNLTPTQNEYVFQYLVDGEIRIGDPYAQKISDPEDQYITSSIYPNLISYPTGKTSGRASVLEVNKTTYNWQVLNFQRNTLPNNLNIYELHFRDFTQEGTYKAAKAKLDYLKNLGINCIHVMPISEFEGNNSWGYNPNYYFAVDKAYGSENDLKEFIDEAHKREIAVVNDLVLNHAFYSNPNAMLYWNKELNRPANDNPWFNPEHKGVYDAAGHWGADWNHASEHTQNMVDDILNYWITEFKFDGFRFDFTKGFTQTAPDPSDPWASSYDVCRVEILKRMVNQMWTNHPGTYAIFEHLAEDAEDKVLADFGILMWSGAGPQYSWAEMAMGTNTKSFWSSVYTSRNFNFANYMSYMESHDEERIGYKVKNWGQNNDNSIAYLSNRLKLPAAFNLMLPGPRMVWQFGELGYDISIDENGRTGDKPSAWELNYNLDPERLEIYNFYGHLFKFRNSFDLYQNINFGNIGSTTDWTRQMSLKDNTANSSGNPTEVIVVGNFDTANGNVVTPSYSYTGDWFKYNGDPAVDGTKYSVNTTTDQFNLNTNDPVYILSNADIIDPKITPSATEITSESACFFIISTNDYDFLEETWTANLPPSEGRAADNSAISKLFYSKINGIETTGEPNSLNGVTLNLGENSIEWVVEDSFGNRNTATQIITITSNAQLPVVTVENPAAIAEGKDAVLTVSNPNINYTYNWYNNEMDNLPLSTGSSYETNILNESTSFWVEAVDNVTLCKSERIMVSVTVQDTTLGTDDFNLNNPKLVFYPNPSKGLLEIKLPENLTDVFIIIYTSDGKIISEKTYNIVNGKVIINIANKPNGMYLAKVYLPQPQIIKILKQ